MANTKNPAKANERRRNILRDVAGIILITLGALVAVAIFTEAGYLGLYLSLGLKWTVGAGRYLVPLFLITLGGAYIAKNSKDSLEAFAFGFVLFFLTIVTAIHLSVPEKTAFEPSYLFRFGGLVGAAFSQIFSRMLGVFGSYILLLGASAASVIFITGVQISDIVGYFAGKSRHPKTSAVKHEGDKIRSRTPLHAEQDISAPKMRDLSRPSMAETVDADIEFSKKSLAHSGSDNQLTMEIERGELSGGYTLPQVSLLRRTQEAKGGLSKKGDKENIAILEQTLADFGVEAKVDKITKGPTVTCYELLIASGTKVNRIVSLADDLALALAAADVRVLAPIPGKAAVGIEVPNQYRELVTIGDILASDEAARHPSAISFGIGKDISGQSVMGDLGEMPHLLIAGATGSGKSICVNALLMSLLLRSRPDQVRMILIDPKRVELTMYNGLPHLLVPVVTHPKEAATALQWAVGEMERRFEVLAGALVRNIGGYNQAIAKGKFPDREPLPFIVIVIDELADLMMVAAGEVEDAICRLAQMARAVGIHLIVATQRPSTDIITGLIKANITSRIAFAVSSQIDSRVILDTPGAEKLVGKGDMLYSAPGSSRPRRVQGAFVTENEIELVTGYIKKQAKPEYKREILEDKKSDMGFQDFEDALYDQALELVVATGQASTSALQRRLRVGYSRAARLIDMLEQRGVVGALDGSKPRAVLITAEELDDIKERG